MAVGGKIILSIGIPKLNRRYFYSFLFIKPDFCLKTFCSKVTKLLKYISTTIFKFELINVHFFQFFCILVDLQWYLSATAGNQPIKNTEKLSKKKYFNQFKFYT